MEDRGEYLLARRGVEIRGKSYHNGWIWVWGCAGREIGREGVWRCVGDEGDGWGSWVGWGFLFRKCGAGSAGATHACAAPQRAALLNRTGARPALLADVWRRIEGRGGYLCGASTAGATKKG